ncbi:ABC-type uncharacterized transport system involved in gliding motility, auxiliary component [Opitutaceae bacterium TAV1]|nr:ABC-type uncharacterized transport system involved in gliding motility, auxiliary component [Opitutaceae bacterium TAV1]
MSLSFRTARWLRTINLLLQAVLVLTLVGGLNYLAINHGWRFDLTQNRRHSLSPETLAYIRTLPAPVTVVVTLAPDADNDEVTQAYRDVTHLLRDYTEATKASEHHITVEFLDIYKQRRDAETWGIEQPNIILVSSGTKRHTIVLNDLYRIENSEKKGFLGEQTLTSAILDVTNPEKKKIYFLEGHGEMRLDDVDPIRGISLLKDELVARGLVLETLDLSNTRKVPDDAALVVIAAPQGSYDKNEQEILRQYLSNRAGRLLVLLTPGYAHGLEMLFYDWGMFVDNVLVIDPAGIGQSDTGDLILSPAKSEHPITRFISENRIAVRFGPSRQVRPLGGDLDPALNVVPLLATTRQAWGERDYRNLQTPPRYDPEADLAGPLAVGTASERTTARANLALSIRGGRVVAYGGADWVANGRLAAGGNLSLILSSINWLIDRDAQLSIPARPIQRYQLTLSKERITQLRYALVFGLPGFAAILGFIVYWTRRR